jgi:hypothetical protein
MENLDLLDYLIPDIQIYSVIHERMKTVIRIEANSDFPIIIGTKGKKGGRPIAFNRKGSVLKNGTECLLFPDAQASTWEGYVTPSVFYQGDIVKAFNDEGKALIAIYSHFDREKQLHYCFHAITDGGKIEYSEHSQVDKFRRTDAGGYFFAKKMFSRMTAGKYEKTENN